MKCLRLNLKAQWYDMIESGTKKEEYREIKDYWTKRLVDENGKFKCYDAVTFVYGYTKRTMTYEIREIVKFTGNTEWGAEKDKEYYVIRLGQRKDEL